MTDNVARADRGQELIAYYGDTHGEPVEIAGVGQNLADMLADLMHFCASTDVPFDEELRTARGHFDAEQKGRL
jgi:hypothetical protein